jgi:hypothetical protein
MMRSQVLIRTIDGALPPALFRRARAAIARLGKERLAKSYWTTFWMPLGAPPAHALEEAVLRLAPVALGRSRAAGAEWWLGRSYTNDVPIELHFDQDVKLSEAGGPLQHPLVSSVLFFNQVRGGQLVVTDQRPGDEHASRLETVKPRANRYAVFEGDRYHGVLDARGRIPSRKLPGPRGRLRLTLVVNFWRARPSGVTNWREARAYRALA